MEQSLKTPNYKLKMKQSLWNKQNFTDIFNEACILHKRLLI